MAITETWLTGDERDGRTLADISNILSDYNIIHKPRENRTGGGVAIIYRKAFTVAQNDDCSYNSMECIDLKICLGGKSLRFINIYRPPPSKKNGLTTNVFFNDFSQLLESLTTMPSHCLITGDFNFHIGTTDTDAQQFTDLINCAALQQHVKSPTHTRGHILDLIMTTTSVGLVSDLKVLPGMPSDHSAITLSVDFPRPVASKVTTERRKLQSIDFETFLSDLSNASLVKNLSADLNDGVLQFNSDLRDLLNDHAPTMKRTTTVRPFAPWYNDHFRELKREKRRCERKWLSSNLEINKQIYQDKALEYYTAIDEAKRKYYLEKISSSTQSELFHLVDGLFTVKSEKTLPTHADQHELATRFCTFFESKISDLIAGIAVVDDDECHQYDNQILCELKSFQPVTAETVKTVIMSSRTKSCSLDPIPTVLLKKCIDVLVHPITTIINSSLSTGIFPSPFKHGLVTPLIKKSDSDPEILKNYRPITNLSFLSKTTERIVSAQLHHYLQSNELYARMQSAYRQNHSTETALLRVHNDICAALDNNIDVVLVLLDLSSAFDMINHQILLKRLKIRYGMDGTVLAWISSYLSDRTQSVKIGQTTSTSNLLTRSVPQGSVLGPTLFSLYVSPIEEIITSYGFDCAVYADDTQLYVSLGKPQHLDTDIAKFQQCISCILDWMSNNELVCNDSKTDVIQFSSRFNKHDLLPNITIGQSKVALKSTVRDLGVTFDNHMTMEAHVNQLCKSACFSLRRVGQIRRYLDDVCTHKLVHALITSKLDHCNSVLYGLPDTILSKLQRIQNSAARLVTRTKRREHITPILRNLHWLPIKKRIIYKVLLLTYKSLHGLGPDYLRSLLQFYNPPRSLRSSSKKLLKVPSTRTKYYGERAFSFNAPKHWNELPMHLKQSASLNTFKKDLKTFLFNYKL